MPLTYSTLKIAPLRVRILCVGDGDLRLLRMLFDVMYLADVSGYK
jgi:hypothetical protein